MESKQQDKLPHLVHVATTLSYNYIQVPSRVNKKESILILFNIHVYSYQEYNYLIYMYCIYTLGAIDAVHLYIHV